jgi:hypothetical protein
LAVHTIGRPGSGILGEGGVQAVEVLAARQPGSRSCNGRRIALLVGAHRYAGSLPWRGEAAGREARVTGGGGDAQVAYGRPR